MRKALYILGTLDDLDVEWLSQKGSVLSLPAGSTLIREGTRIDHMYILLEGELSVRIGTDTKIEVAKLLPGEVVGEMSVVNSRPPSASVITMRDSFLLSIGREALDIKIAADMGFASRFFRAIAIFLADRLYVTTGRFGYGNSAQDVDVDEIDDSAMDDVSMGSLRFDLLVKQLRNDYRLRSTGS